MKHILIFLFMCSFLLRADLRPPCDCKDRTVEEIVKQTGLILRGRFISAPEDAWYYPLQANQKEKHREYYCGKIVVTETLKGDKFSTGDTIELIYNYYYIQCAGFYQLKKEYLFFAHEYNNGMVPDSCSLTCEFAKKDTTYLKTKKLLNIKY